MSEPLDATESEDFEQILARFHAELEDAADPEPIIRKYEARHPGRAKDFGDAVRMRQILDHSAEEVDSYRPERLGDFRIVREISRGGMKIIYEAVQEPLDRRVAVAMIRRGRVLSPHRERFLREQQVLAKLHQTNIVPVFAAGEDGPIQYFAMPYIEGATLSHVVRAAFEGSVKDRSGKTPPLGRLAEVLVEGGEATVDQSPGSAETEEIQSEEPSSSHEDPGTQTLPLSREYFRSVARVMAGVADSLQHAHEHGFLHRDLKPANIMVDTSEQSWLIDFGLAGCIQASERLGSGRRDAEIGEPLTLTHQVMGTPGYMAPEQERAGLTDERTDVWGLGVTLYELLTLRRAFPRKERECQGEQVQSRRPKPPRELVQGLPRDLEAICLKALKPEAGHRYPSASEFGADLNRWLEGEPTVARPARAPRRAYLWARRNKGWALAMMASVLAMIALGVGGLIAADAAEQKQEAAEQKQQVEKRKSLMLEVQGTVAGQRQAGWSEKAWKQVIESAAIEVDSELRDLAVSSLLGLDASLVEIQNIPAVSVAFDDTGRRVVFSGSDGVARMWSRDNDRVRVGARRGAGPVFFGPNETPCQLAVESPRRLVIRDVMKAEVLLRLDIPDQWEGMPEDPMLYAAAVSPNREYLAVSYKQSGETGITALWNIESGKSMRQFPMKANALAWSDDDGLLAAGDEKGHVAVWSVDEGQEFARLSSDDLAIHSLAFTLDRRRHLDERADNWLMAVGDAGGTVTIWDVGRGLPINYCRGARHHVYDVEFSPDGVMLASCGRHAVKLWDVGSGQQLLDIYVSNTTYDIDFAPDGKTIATASIAAHGDPGGVALYELEPGRGIRTLRGLRQAVYKVWFSPGGMLLAALSHDWRVGVWDVASDRLLHVIQVPSGDFTDNSDLAFSPDNQRLAFSSGARATLWNIATGRCEQTWELPRGLGDCIRFRDEKALLLFRFETKDGKVGPFSNAHPDIHPRVCRLRDLMAPDPLTPLMEISEFNWNVFFTNAAPDGSTFVVDGIHNGFDGRRRTVRAYDGLTGKELWTLPIPRTRDGGTLGIDPTGRLLLVMEADTQPNGVLLELRSKKYLGRRESSRCLASEAEYIVRSGRMEFLRETDAEPFLRLAPDKATGCRQAQFSRDGRLVAWGTQDGTVSICELRKVRQRLKVNGLIE